MKFKGLIRKSVVNKIKKRRTLMSFYALKLSRQPLTEYINDKIKCKREQREIYQKFQITVVTSVKNSAILRG